MYFTPKQKALACEQPCGRSMLGLRAGGRGLAASHRGLWLVLRTAPSEFHRGVSTCRRQGPLFLRAGPLPSLAAAIFIPPLVALATPRMTLSAPRLPSVPPPQRAIVRRNPALLDVPRLALRACWLGILLLPSLLLLLPAMLLPTGRREAWLDRFGDALVRALERGGPCLTKLGQWASTRPDLLPPSLCSSLASLHHRVRAHSLDHTKRAIAASFGVPSEQLFEELSDAPVGSGCIAQVHEARARDGATRLAVKVLHPGVEQLVADDLYLMRAGTSAAHALLGTCVSGLRWLALKEALDEFARFMGRQLDLTHEAHNLERFAENFRDEAHITFPRPIRSMPGTEAASEPLDLVSREVLVETFIDGQTLSAMLLDDEAARKRDGGGAAPAERKARNTELARLGLRAFLTMLLKHNFVHADLHPGNILVSSSSGGGGASHQLGLVDAGLVVELEERDRRNFMHLFKAIAKGDGGLAGELMLTRSKEQRCADPEAFTRGMREVVASARAGERGAFNLSNVRIGDVLLEVTNLVRTHQVQVDASFTTLVCAIVVLEGLGRQLDPSLDLFSVALSIGF